ncbi:MAG: hypothetical protein U0359_07395 [Byssovorax sp.]
MSLRARRGPALFALALLAALLALVVARPAHAWVDVTIEGDEARVAIQPDGRARVEHRITLKIAGGPLRALDLRGVDRDAVPELDGYVVPEREAQKSSLASAVPVTLELVPPGNKPEADGSPPLSTLRIRFDNERGLGRGVYVILARYTTNLAPRISADGAMAKVTWKGPVWPDGLASVRTTFELPAAPTEPRADDARAQGVAPAGALDPQGADRPLILSTVRRGLKTDALELLRPYVPKGEAAIWNFHADLRAFSLTAPPKALPAPSPKPADLLGEPALRTLWIALGITIFLAYSVIVALKSAEVAREAIAAGTTAAPVVPLPPTVRALLAGALLTLGLWIELFARRATIGAALVLFASLLAAHRPPPWKRGSRLRGPGKWLPVAEAKAFGDPPRAPGGYLDVSTRPGKVVFALALLAFGAGVALLHEESPYQASLVAFDITALLAIFGTGMRKGLPPDPGKAPARFLRDVARRLAKLHRRDPLRVIGRIRVPEGASEPDELRLSIAPRRAIQGFGAIEIGVTFAPGMGGPIGLPEILLRVNEASACEAALAEVGKLGRAARGRKAKERVLSFSPRLPTARMTAALASKLVAAVTATAAQAEGTASEPARARRAA